MQPDAAPTAPEQASPLAKLRRRKVVQWSVAYGASAWVLLQVLGYVSGIYCEVHRGPAVSRHE
jgi:hypothetical protein